jgi:hypothetical protein
MYTVIVVCYNQGGLGPSISPLLPRSDPAHKSIYIICKQYKLSDGSVTIVRRGVGSEGERGNGRRE